MYFSPNSTSYIVAIIVIKKYYHFINLSSEHEELFYKLEYETQHRVESQSLHHEAEKEKIHEKHFRVI